MATVMECHSCEYVKLCKNAYCYKLTLETVSLTALEEVSSHVERHMWLAAEGDLQGLRAVSSTQPVR